MRMGGRYMDMLAEVKCLQSGGGKCGVCIQHGDVKTRMAGGMGKG